jgi:UDP-N-acetylglucosamine 1-carboxyvinyltransferase
MGSIIQKLRDTGVRLETGSASMTVQGNGQLRAADVATKEYPGFATDMQAQYMALMTQSVGTSVITENIFENRFMHASELMRMGADIRIDGARAIVTGKTRLSGATVIASDLRASASLVIAGLVADGTTIIDRVYHLDRGYEKIEEKLRSVGANIERLK